MGSLFRPFGVIVRFGSVFCVLLWSIHARGQDTDYRTFVKTVDSVYNNLTFSGVDFPVTGIKLRRVPYGIAFARFEPKINQRTVLFNYAYFYEKYWKAAKADSTRHNIRDMISGVLAHEWAHHYMGHTFERNTIIKERDADIMAGRVMYENLINDPVNDNIGLNLKRSLLTIKVLENAPQSAYHLSANAREGLIRKGFITGLIIHYKKKGGVCPLIQKLVDAKIASLESLTGLAQNTLCKETKQQAQAALEARKDIPNSLKEKIYISDCYSFSSTAILPDSIKQLSIKLTTQFKNQYDSLWRIRKISILKPFLISDAISQDMVQNYIINPAPGSTIGIETESIYNLLYNGKNTNTLRCTPNLTVTIPKSFTTHKAKADTDSILTYTLQYGATKIKIYMKGIMRAEVFENNRLVGSNSVCDLIKNDQICDLDENKYKSLFRYSFIADKVKYFIDNNYHLWTETLGAKPLGNKLFLQVNNYVNP